MANPDLREGGGPSSEIAKVAESVQTQLEQINSSEDASRVVHDIISQLREKYGHYVSSSGSGKERSQVIFSFTKKMPGIGDIYFSLTQPAGTDFCVLNMTLPSEESTPGAIEEFISTLSPTDQEYLDIHPDDFEGAELANAA